MLALSQAAGLLAAAVDRALLQPSLPGFFISIVNLLFIAVLTDITLRTYKTVLDAFIDRQEKLRMATVYEHLSKTDPLTGIDNRTILKTNLDKLLEEGASRISILWLDLDRFKQHQRHARP